MYACGLALKMMPFSKGDSTDLQDSDGSPERGTRTGTRGDARSEVAGPDVRNNMGVV